MSEKTPSFPLGPVLLLFGFLGVFLITLLSGQPQIPPAKPITPTVVAAAATATQTAPAPTAVQVAQALPYTDLEVKQGRDLFAGTCVACHGPEARGIPGLGKNLTTSTFVSGLTDDELIAFIIKGRPVGDPLNTTGVAMPASGGNPSLDNAKLHLIVAFIRSQHVKYANEATAAPTATLASAGTEKPFVLPIQSLGLITPTATQAFVLPIQSLGLVTPTQLEGSATQSSDTATTVPTVQPTEAAPATATTAGQFVLPIQSLGFVTPTEMPNGG
jgi:mono/diheme cytochrome c family protein